MTTLPNGSHSKENKEEPVRKLRSKDKTKNSNKQKLFNFDNTNELLYRNKQILITNSKIDPTTVPYYFEVNDLPQLPKKNPIEIINPVLPRKSKHIEDPLPDSIYELFHRKMTKEEKVMNNEERSRILSEVDNLQTQLNLLNQYDWIRHLPTVASVNNINDYKELELKKQLTINEIERLLRKHDNWRRRLERLNNDIRECEYEELSDDPDYELSLTELKAKRAKERVRKYGPVIKLRLNHDTYLVIDPLNTPRIVKGNTSLLVPSEPATPKRPMSSPVKVNNGHIQIKLKHLKEPETTDNVTRITRRNRVRLEDISDVNIIKVNPEDTDFVFGTCYENINAHMEGFQLPLRLRRNASNSQ